MKGFMKGCGIAALILVVLGTILFCVAVATRSTDEVADIAYDTAHGFLNFNKSDVENFKEWAREWKWGSHDDYEYDDDVFDDWSYDDNSYFDIEDASDYNSDYEVYQGTFELSLPSLGVNKLDLGLGGCVFRILESDSSDFKVSTVNSGKVQAYVLDGTLKLLSTRSANVWNDIEKCEIELYLPKGVRFQEISMEMGAGRIEIGRLAAEEMELSVGAGSIYGEYLEATKLDVSSGAGDIQIDDMTVQELDAAVGAGRIILQGSAQSVDGECAVGSLEMLLNGSRNDFDYRLECMAGNINIEDSNYTGLTQERTVNNGTGRLIDLECTMGNIMVNFQ